MILGVHNLDVKLKPCLAQNIWIWIIWQLYLCTNETTVNSLTLTWFCCCLCTDKSWSFVDVVFMGTTMDVKYFLRVHFFLLSYILRPIFLWDGLCLSNGIEMFAARARDLRWIVVKIWILKWYLRYLVILYSVVSYPSLNLFVSKLLIDSYIYSKHHTHNSVEVSE